MNDLDREKMKGSLSDGGMVDKLDFSLTQINFLIFGHPPQ